MTRAREVHCYDYVNRPYVTVRDALALDPKGIFQRATVATAARAGAIGAELHVALGPLAVTAEIAITIVSVEDATELGQPATRLVLEWNAKHRASMFPTMRATLSIYALSPTETQLDLLGTYDPPLGIFGDAIDKVILHRIAQASAHHFIRDVSGYLRAELPQTPGPGATYWLEPTD
jgi:hypothetical protein